MSLNNDIYKSLIATGIAEMATLPICNIKTNYQNTKSTSIISTIKSIYSRYGIRSFYSGSYWSIGSQMFSTASKYAIYSSLKRNGYTNNVVNGIASGLITSLFTHPLDALKVHTQMDSKLVDAIKKDKIYFFYRGYSKTLSKITVGSATFFPLYDYFKNNHYTNLQSAFATSVIATSIMHPFDYLKVRHIYDQKLHYGLNMFKGYSLNIMRVVPHFMITMYIIDNLKI